MHAQQAACSRSPPSQRNLTQRQAHAPARLAPPSACKPRSRRTPLVAVASRHVVAAALTEQDLTKRALRLDSFEAQAVSEVRQCARRWLAWSLTDNSSRRLRGCAPRSEPMPTRATRLRSSGFCVTASWTSRRRRRRCDAPNYCSQVSLTRCAGAGSVLFGVARRRVFEACCRRRGDRGGNWQSAAAGGARPGASALERSACRFV